MVPGISSLLYISYIYIYIYKYKSKYNYISVQPGFIFTVYSGLVSVWSIVVLYCRPVGIFPNVF